MHCANCMAPGHGLSAALQVAATENISDFVPDEIQASESTTKPKPVGYRSAQRRA